MLLLRWRLNLDPVVIVILYENILAGKQVFIYGNCRKLNFEMQFVKKAKYTSTVTNYKKTNIYCAKKVMIVE